MDTPGDLVEAMRDIVGDTLASQVRVIVDVSPRRGSRRLGRCDHHVCGICCRDGAWHYYRRRDTVGLEGESVSDKVVSDAAAQAEALATLRGRNVEFAVDAVRRGAFGWRR